MERNIQYLSNTGTLFELWVEMLVPILSTSKHTAAVTMR